MENNFIANEQNLNENVTLNAIGVVSRKFRMGSGDFFTYLIFKYGAAWLLSLLVVALVGLTLGIVVDIKWFVLGLMVIFVVIPMAMSIFYYFYGLKKGFFVNMVNHTIEVTDDAIKISVLPKAVAKEDSDKDSETADNEVEEVKPVDYYFSYSELSGMREGRKAIIFPLKKYKDGFIWIPFDAFENENDFSKVVAFIDSKVSESV